MARAMRLIRDGVIDREGVTGIARRLAYSQRQLNRLLIAEVGAGPLALARAQRAQTARILLETTDMIISDAAFASGFASVRQFNDTIRAVFSLTPTELRSRSKYERVADGVIELRLPFRAPMNVESLLEFLGHRAIPGIERFDGVTFARTLDLPGGPALAELSNGAGYIRCRLRLTDHHDLVAAVARLRRLLDLDADPVAVDAVLEKDTHLASLVRKRPGLRSPGAVDGFEMAVRAVVGQQISVVGARNLLGRIAGEVGTVAFEGDDWRLFPTPARMAKVAHLPMPKSRSRTLHAVAEAFASGDVTVDAGANRQTEREKLLALPGIGPWTADYLLMRAMGDPDILLTSDLGVRKAAEAAGIDISDDRRDWAPWRSYATHHLWQSLGDQK